jgi:DNA-binding transcriptional ArsR family regulator/uncharacterized protein YndB with AHSA1/START domain
VESESVWRALASPHRRKLLDLLKEGPRTTGQLSKEMPDLSRFAVMQHLGVLEEAGMIVVERRGRTRRNYLNPIPIRQLYERWMRSHSSTAAEAALHLKRYAESTSEVVQTMDANEYRLVNIEMEMIVKAPRERVFAALTDEYGNWWPHRYKPDSKCTCDARVGGRYGETFRDGGGAIYGEIVYFEPGRLVITTGPSSLAKGMSAYSRESVEDHPDGALYKRSMQMWGSISDDLETMFRDGTRLLMETALRNYVEQGVAYEAPLEAGS